jgi:hypothetical protein
MLDVFGQGNRHASGGMPSTWRGSRIAPKKRTIAIDHTVIGSVDLT